MRRTTTRLWVLGWVLAAWLVPAQASRADSETQAYLVKVHADWCGTCTRLNPVWNELQARYGAQAKLVLLDVTNREALERSRQEAEQLGLTAFFDAHKSKTGTIAVLDPSGEPVQVFKGELDVAAYEAALRKLGVEARS